METITIKVDLAVRVDSTFYGEEKLELFRASAFWPDGVLHSGTDNYPTRAAAIKALKMLIKQK